MDIGAFARASRCAGLCAGVFHWWCALFWLVVAGVWWLLVGLFDGSVFVAVVNCWRFVGISTDMLSELCSSD